MRHVFGTMAALVRVLKSDGIVPLKAPLWKRGDQAWQFAPRGPLQPFLAEMGDFLRGRVWRSASKHYLGGCLERGPPDITALVARARKGRRRAARKRRRCSKPSPAAGFGTAREGTSAV